MWFSFWRSRNRFSMDELRYLTDQLMKVQIVNEVNKDFVIEALRSIAELITYGDQHDTSFFEFFMEKQVMGEFVRILKVSRTGVVSLQLLQTMSIMIQNLKNEHSIYYMFSNEHINHLITYSFDFGNEELLSYYISFLRAISGKLNKNTISLLVKTQNDEVVSFPLYVEAIRFAFHEEGMVRNAVRALTLNVYHVGDEFVNKYVARAPRADYFLTLVKFFREQCISLDRLVSNVSKNHGPESVSIILSAVDEIEDNLYYFSDVISAGIPDVGRLITDNILKLLIFPLLLPSLGMEVSDETGIGAVTSLYLLCCILRIVKIKDLASTVAVALFCPKEAFMPSFKAKVNGYKCSHDFSHESQKADDFSMDSDSGSLQVSISNSSSSSQSQLDAEVSEHICDSSHLALRETLLSYVTSGTDVKALGSLSVLATLLQTKELDETMLDALGILPQRKQHKKLLLQALVGESSCEERLFFSENSLVKDGISSEFGSYFQKLKLLVLAGLNQREHYVKLLNISFESNLSKQHMYHTQWYWGFVQYEDQYGVLCSCPKVGPSPRTHRFQVLDSLVSLLSSSNISAETLWDGGWLLRQLLPYSEAEFSAHHLKLLKDAYKHCAGRLLTEARGIWPDLLIKALSDEWRKCKRAMEASSPRREPKSILMPSQKSFSEEVNSGESSVTAGKRMCELVKVFVLLHQLQIFSLGRVLPDQPPVDSPIDLPEKSRAKTAGVPISGPKPSTELNLADAVACRISFERGKERHFFFLAMSMGTSGWVVLAEELPLKSNHGVVRVSAPLAGCSPKLDEKHSRWLHLRIRPSSLPFMDSSNHAAQVKVKTNTLVDGRWTLAFRDEDSCKSALSMILDELNSQHNEVQRRLKPLLDVETVTEFSDSASFSGTAHSL